MHLAVKSYSGKNICSLLRWDFWTGTRRMSKECHPTVMNNYLCKAERLCKLLGDTAVCMLGGKKVEIR